mgnify:FL=1
MRVADADADASARTARPRGGGAARADPTDEREGLGALEAIYLTAVDELAPPSAKFQGQAGFAPPRARALAPTSGNRDARAGRGD